MSEEEVEELIEGLSNKQFGYVLRGKGVVPAIEGGYWHFDYTVSKGSVERVSGMKDEINRIIVIGSELNKRELRKFIYSFGDEDL